MNLYLDCEMNGLSQYTDILSLALLGDDGNYFYAEFMYPVMEYDPWVAENVIPKFKLKGEPEGMPTAWMMGKKYNDGALESSLGFTYTWTADSLEVLSGWESIGRMLKIWLEKKGPVEIWSDVCAYDWVLFCELFQTTDTAERLPKNVYYIPFDIATLMKIKGVDPDISREEFAELPLPWNKHNALFDARVIQACYRKLMEMK